MLGSLNSPYLTTSRVIGLLLPLMVRSPVNLYLSLPACSILVLLKVMVGYLSTSRKLDERRSLSRVSLWVRMLAELMGAWISDRSGGSTAISPVPGTPAK